MFIFHNDGLQAGLGCFCKTFFFMGCGAGGLTKPLEVGCLEWVAWTGLARLADMVGKFG